MTPADGGPVVARSQRGSTTSRIAALGALALVVIAVGYLLLSGGGTENQYRLLFENGGQLVNGNQVMIGGQPVGKVKSVELTDDSQAEVTITVDRDLHEGSEAVIRSTSLSGIANRYVSIAPGPDNAPELGDDAVITQADTTSPVDLDQLFDTFDAKARRGLRDIIQGYGAAYAGRGVQANAAYKFLNPSLVASSRLFAELTADQQVLQDFLVNGSGVMTALAERRNDLCALISNANEGLGAIASQNVALDRSLQALPPVMRQANTTFVNLRAAFDDLDSFVAASKPATKNLAPFLRKRQAGQRQVRAGLPATCASRSGARGRTTTWPSSPRTSRPITQKAHNAFPQAIKAERCSTVDPAPCGSPAGSDPPLRFIRPYTPGPAQRARQARADHRLLRRQRPLRPDRGAGADLQLQRGHRGAPALPAGPDRQLRRHPVPDRSREHLPPLSRRRHPARA